MNTREAVRALASGSLVYIIVASCSPASGRPPSALNDSDAAFGAGGLVGAAGALGTAGTVASGAGTAGTSSGGRSILDAAIDRLVDPVPDAAADPNTSGTRLRARYLVGSDGSRQFQGWRDIERSEDCSFLLAEDGTQRCLPSGASTLATVFTDAGCTQVVAVSPKGACPTEPKYASVVTSGCPFARWEIWSLGGAISSVNLYSGTPSNCTTIPATTFTTSYDVYAVGAKVTAASFVAATESVE